MTLDELIEKFRDEAKSCRIMAGKFENSEDNYIRRAYDYDEAGDYLEELKIYKKALYMACNGQEYLVQDFLQKVREKDV